MTGNLGKGLHFEERARQYLAERGMRCIEQNYRSRWGEIDLIMHDGDTLCFVEVKYRKSMDYGGSACALPRHKQQKIARTALVYLAAHPRQSKQSIRFDALLIQRQPDGSNAIEWIKNAFYADQW